MFKKLLVVVCAVFMLGGIAKADIIGSGPNNVFNLGQQKETLASPSFNSSTFLTDITAIINDLGTVEGPGYDFIKHNFINEIGATVVTYQNTTIPALNLALDAELYNDTGLGGALDYNLQGALQPFIGNIPVLSLVQNLHVNFGGGYDWDINSKRLVLGISYKANF